MRGEKRQETRACGDDTNKKRQTEKKKRKKEKRKKVKSNQNHNQHNKCGVACFVGVLYNIISFLFLQAKAQ